MYEDEYDGFNRLYQALTLFQARALTNVMSGENTEERLRRALFVVEVIAKANRKLDKHFPEPQMLRVSTECGAGLVNCHGVCIDPNGCWDHISKLSKRSAASDDPKAGA